MKGYLNALQEILTNTFNFVTAVAGIITLLLGIFSKRYDLLGIPLITTISLGILISSVVTVKNRNEMINKIEGSDKGYPTVGIYIKNIKPYLAYETLRIRNTSNIRIHGISFDSINETDGPSLFDFKFEMDGTDILIQNEERSVIVTSITDGRQPYIPYFLSPNSTHSYPLNVYYRDDNEHKYQMCFSIGKGGIKQMPGIKKIS
jgi:hypothetical protein